MRASISLSLAPANNPPAPRQPAPPPPRFLKRAFRCGLAITGLAWICCASVLCGCNSVNGYVMNESGKAYYRRGEYSLARHEFERALMDSPENPHYAYNVAAAMQQQGDSMAAERMYQHALVLDPSHTPAYEGLAHMLNAQGRSPEAEQLLTAWSSTQPYIPESSLSLARLQENRGDVGAAEQSLQRALAANPKHRKVHDEMGKLYRRSGRNREAADSFGQSLAGNPYDDQTQTELASLFQSQNQGTSPALLMANQMPQYDPYMRSNTFAQPAAAGAMPTAPYAGAPSLSQNVAPSVYTNMYGRSPYNQVGPSFSWGTSSSVPLPQTMNAIAAQSAQQQQMGWNTGFAVDPNAQMMAGSPSQQFNGMAVTSSPVMMQPAPGMVDGGSAPMWNVQPTMAPAMAGQATTANYAPLPGQQPAVIGAGGFAPPPVAAPQVYGYPMASPAPIPGTAPTISATPAVPAF
jgi:Flp pilus assembly protein TadD